MKTNLNEAIAAREAARTKHQADVEALALGRQRLAESEAEVKRFEQADAEAIERHAKRAEAQTREGKTGPIPTLVPTEKHLAAHLNAHRTRSAATLMVQNLEAAERVSLAALAQAEAAANKATQEAFDAETRAEFEAFQTAWQSVLRRRERLYARRAVRENGLTDREWLKLSQRPECLTGTELGIGEPIVGWSIYDADHPFARNSASAQARVAAFAAEHQQRLVHLRTHGTDEPPAQEVAA